mmetsp:Transcript_21462/g.31920  ORF Transcript_21462/g.31920 Transcript_21462/m.31920 type:complete len:618 (-) Transcript_21462:94-1947(-)|eukprot:CAMPEP_0167762250 /NCGR_PEP_ID=MMETSP0110_2-20121227/12655_1 /TAXON_ID=629695 /ORGANISM="Gymnochlora sp., Strain CCMP2014" /LENGTH=617 /DNA_ID=CAMNT_0007649087 /DNA_START=193 /DNA_END=2046 /DNA_ORIENTATION=-
MEDKKKYSEDSDSSDAKNLNTPEVLYTLQNADSFHRQKMKGTRSMHDMSSVRERVKRRAKMRRNARSMPDMRDPLRSILASVPFYAIHGLSSQLRAKRKRGLLSRKTSDARKPSTVSDDLSDDLIEAAGFGKQGCTPRLSVVVLGALMGAINFGYNTSVLNTPEKVIRSNLGNREIDGFSWAIIVSIFAVGGLIGSSLAPPLLDTIGRKSFMFYNGIFMTLSILFEASSTSVITMVLSRLLIGMSCGCSTVSVPLYLGEIAPLSLRGALGTLNQFAMVIGILLANLLGKPLGTDEGWRFLLGIGAIFSVIQVMMSVFMVESPRWLVTKGDMREARRLLLLIRGASENSRDNELIFMELETMEVVSEEEKQEISVGTLVRNPSSRKPFLIGVALMLFQQFSGINAVFYYSTSFFEKAHFDDPFLGTVLAATVNVIATGLAVDLMDRAGRRPLLVISSLGMCFSSLVLTVALVLSQYKINLGSLEISGMLLYVAFFEIGLGPIPWAITAELFGAVERATAMGACSCMNWVANFLVGLTFPAMNSFLGPFAFVPFACVTLIAAIFSNLTVPETKGMSLEEIREQMFGTADMKELGRNVPVSSLPSIERMKTVENSDTVVY